MEEDLIHRDRGARNLVEGKPPKRERSKTTAEQTPEQEQAGNEAREKKKSLTAIKRDVDLLATEIYKPLLFSESSQISPEALHAFEDRLDDLRSRHESTQQSTREERAEFFADIEESLQNFEAEVQKLYPTLQGIARSRNARMGRSSPSFGDLPFANTSRYERAAPPTSPEADTLSEKDVAERAERVALQIYADLLALSTEKLQSLLELATPEEKESLQNPDLLDDTQSRSYLRAMKKAHDTLDDLEERGRPIPGPVEEAPYPRSKVELRSAPRSEDLMSMETSSAPRHFIRRTPRRAPLRNKTASSEFETYSGPLVSLPSNEVAQWAQESLGIADAESFFTKYESLSRDDERREDLLSPEAQAFLATHDAQDVIALMKSGMETSSQPKGIFGRIKNLFSQPAREMKVLERVVREFDDLLLEATPKSGRGSKSKRPDPRSSPTISITTK